jgi:radical SAM protein with 4Fe4S-binding SPASM domain
VLVIRHYLEEHYSTFFNPRTGFFARAEDRGCPEPFWSAHGPELMDISITGRCDRGCDQCYRNSTATGLQMSLADYEIILSQAREMQVSQVALGGGNPNQHPDFVKILRRTRDHFGIVPSYTTNGRGLTDDVLAASRAVCGAVAVSAYEPFREAGLAINRCVAAGVRTNVHFVLDKTSIHTAVAWLESTPSFLDGINALVFLTYKPVGRGSHTDSLLSADDYLRGFLAAATENGHPFKIGFDSCLVPGLASFTTVEPQYYEACEAARFSMFISEKLHMYPCSFMESTHRGTSIHDSRIADEWRNGRLFTAIRSTLQSARCPECRFAGRCLGGCPVFPQINVCRLARGNEPTSLSKAGHPYRPER